MTPVDPGAHEAHDGLMRQAKPRPVEPVRRRPHVNLTLSQEEIDLADELATGRFLTRSTLVGQLVREEAERVRKKSTREGK